MEFFFLELDEEEITVLMEAHDHYLAELMQKNEHSKENNKKMYIMTGIGNKICHLNQK